MVATSARGYLSGEPSTSYDLVLIDPPYDVTEPALAEGLDLLTGWLAPGATVVVERARRSPEPSWPTGLQLDDERRYGDTTLWFASAT